MTKLLAKMTLLSLVLLPVASTAPALAATTWDVTGNYVVEFQLTGDPTVYAHDMSLVQDGLDNVAGGGGYPTGGPFSYAWTITDGEVVGTTINLTMDYTLGAVGTTMHMAGTIDSNGSMSGSWDDNFGGVRTGTWATTSGNAVEDNDTDDDGVLNGADLCPNTGDDTEWSVSWGQNRWQVEDGTWYQNKVKKGASTPTAGQSIDYTYGCNGHQIIAMLNEELGSAMNGHLKYGLSSGVLEEFHQDLSDGVLDGMYLLETVQVYANDADGISSTATLLSGHDYVLKAHGTADACVSGCGYSIIFDPEYSTSDGTSWVDGVAEPYVSEGPNLLDLKVNGGFVDWGTYNSAHQYSIGVAGTDAPVSFQVNDVYYPNNAGSLTVDIYAQI